MYKRSFEIFSKYISKEHNVSIVYDTDGSAYADMQNDVLHLPAEIANENALGALALTCHEASHIRHSKIIPVKRVAPMQSDFHILNAIEDIRIDLKNFGVLPNIFAFYEQLVKKHLDLTDPKIPESNRLLCAGILHAEGFYPKLIKSDMEWMVKNPLVSVLNRGTQEIENNQWKDLIKTIAEIKKMLKIDSRQDKQNQATTINGAPNGEQQQETATQIQGDPNGKDGQKPSGKPDPNNLSGVGKLLRPAAVWGKGKAMPGGSAMATSPLAMDEQCANQFKEILNVKETKIIEEGTILDTDNLTAFYTGNIEELFKQELTIRKKKSKVMFLLDCSGSMQTKMIDNKSRAQVVKSCTQKLTEILNEVHELEGINVDWCISQFDDSYSPLTKESWQTIYIPSGGTNFIEGFTGAMNDMLADYTVEGKRIIILFSDGDVNPSEIDHANDLIRKHGADVRVMIIGVGSNMAGRFVKEVAGENVIIAQDGATEIILEAIKTML